MEQLARPNNKNLNLTLSSTIDLNSFFGKYPLRNFEKNRIFLFPDEKPLGVYYVEQGFVRVFDITQNGNEVVVNIFTQNTIFPMAKALNKTQNHYFYQAGKDLKLRIAPTQEFKDFLRLNPDIAIDLLSKSYLNAQRMRRRMAHLMGGSAFNRLIFELVLQAYSFGNRKTDVSYILDINEAEIGARSGLSRETVSRELRSLKLQGALFVGQGQITITNIKSLEAKLGSNL